jgi:hypothetical protein
MQSAVFSRLGPEHVHSSHMAGGNAQAGKGSYIITGDKEL